MTENIFYWRLARRMSAIWNVRTTFHVRKRFHATISFPHGAFTSKTSAIIPPDLPTTRLIPLLASILLSLPFRLSERVLPPPWGWKGRQDASRDSTGGCLKKKLSRHRCNTDFTYCWFYSLSRPALINCTHSVKTVSACFNCHSCGCQPEELFPLWHCCLCRGYVYCFCFMRTIKECLF